jgi:hypothetical protein
MNDGSAGWGRHRGRGYDCLRETQVEERICASQEPERLIFIGLATSAFVGVIEPVTTSSNGLPEFFSNILTITA